MREKPETVHFWRGDLPHWEVVDGRYFVTIRLRGAIPEAGMRRIRCLKEKLEAAVANGCDGLKERRAIFCEMENWLETAPRLDYLRRPAAARVIAEAINYRHDCEIWTMFEAVTMPNHIHLFFRLGRNAPWEQAAGAEDKASHCLRDVLRNFKRWTARRIAGELGINGSRFWQREWFDHWSRSAEEDEKTNRYIRMNPVKAGLVRSPEEWPYRWPNP